MKYKIMSGNEACAYVSYLFTEIAGVYPITPSTEMSELIEKYSSDNRKNIFNNNVKIIEMQSEKGSIALVHGALENGSLASTYTSSQGLLLMIPSMYKIAGEMLPCVINVASRTISTHALSIFGDHSDIYAVRSTGFAILASSSVQDVFFNTLISYLSTIKSSIPFLNFFDGFRTSHEINKIKVIDDNEIKSLVNYKLINNFKNSSLAIKKRIKGVNENDDIYFQNLEVRNKYYDELPDVVNEYMEKINEKYNFDFHPFNYYGNKVATKIIVAMGSVCDTIKEYIKNTEEKIGLIEVHLFRPFSEKYFLNVLPKSVKKIAVLDRAKEIGGSGEPLYLDVVSIINKLNKKILVVGGRYGISSKDTDLYDIKAVYDNLDNENIINSFTIGIQDDVTNKSLKKEKFKYKNKNNIEMLIYGYGSDGMISSSKNLIKIIGENTNGFVQGYFRYDSKKSGGLTISNIRIGKEEIKLPYYVKNPQIVVCTNDYYLYKYNILDNIKKNGIFILVTDKEENDIPNNIKNIIKEKNLNFYTIDAFSISSKNNISNKISTIVEMAIIKVTNLLPYKLYKEKLIDLLKINFKEKGQNIIQNNINAIENVENEIKNIKINDITINETKTNKKDNLIDKINYLDGYNVKVSEMISHKDGSFDCFTSEREQLFLSSSLPFWKSDTCIQCNKCSIVCPHGVIESKILTNEEIKNNDNIIYEELIGKKGYYFALEFNYEKCTGCGICIKSCVGKRGMKALEMIESKVHKKMNQKIISTQKDIFDDNSIKGIGFNESLFKYPSACKGCGETPYLKLLTKIFSDGIIISNATGCSSIYGGNINNPYNISWSNSLFEDNAEYGLGMNYTLKLRQEEIEKIMMDNINNVNSKNKKLFERWINNKNNYKITKEIKENIDYNEIPELMPLKDYISTKSVWIIGGDGWSYDIDFDGIDHIMSSNENVNILILDTEVYSNTGGQTSKSTPKGSRAKFSINGKKNKKKDLARMMMSYNNVYVAQISLGANMLQSLKAIKEAQKFNGPSLIIAYSPCINHQIKDGMSNSIEQEKLAVQSGYFPLFRYNGKLMLDYKEPNFDLYDDFLRKENRFYTNLDDLNELLEESKNDAINRFNYYKELENKKNSIL